MAGATSTTGPRPATPHPLVPPSRRPARDRRPRRASAPDRYRYDPADPTPSVGGIGMLTGGPVDNRAPRGTRRRARVHQRRARRAARARSGRSPAELLRDLERSTTSTSSSACATSTPTAGRSTSATGCSASSPDSIARDADGVFVADVALWPIGHRFAAGHRVRVQVSSGSHPVYARNLGTGEPYATAVDIARRRRDRAPRPRPPVGGRCSRTSPGELARSAQVAQGGILPATFRSSPTST